MRIFRIDDIIDDIQKELPVKLPKAVIKHICNFAIRKIAKIITGRKGSLKLYKSDIHTVYRDPESDRICAEFADLNETKMPNDKVRTIRDNESKGVYLTVRNTSGVERVFIRRHNRRAVRSRQSTKEYAEEVS